MAAGARSRRNRAKQMKESSSSGLAHFVARAINGENREEEHVAPSCCSMPAPSPAMTIENSPRAIGTVPARKGPLLSTPASRGLHYLLLQLRPAPPA